MGARPAYPTPDEGMYLVGIHPLRVAEQEEERAPGTEVPEAFAFPRRRIDALVGTRRLTFQPHRVNPRVAALVRASVERLSPSKFSALCRECGVEEADVFDVTVERLLVWAGIVEAPARPAQEPPSAPAPDPSPATSPTTAQAATTPPVAAGEASPTPSATETPQGRAGEGAVTPASDPPPPAFEVSFGAGEQPSTGAAGSTARAMLDAMKDAELRELGTTLAVNGAGAGELARDALITGILKVSGYGS